MTVCPLFIGTPLTLTGLLASLGVLLVAIPPSLHSLIICTGGGAELTIDGYVGSLVTQGSLGSSSVSDPLSVLELIFCVSVCGFVKNNSIFLFFVERKKDWFQK